MKKIFKLKKIITVLFSLFIVLVSVSCSKESDKKEIKISHINATFAVDVDSPYELVGFSDYYFICEIISQKDTEYRDPITIETENDSEEVSSPYTNYEVKVIKNIKGDLPLDENITITKAGGVAENGDLILYENDSLLETGKFYSITASAQPDGSLLVSGPNSSQIFESISESSSDKYEKFEEIYENEVDFDRERFEYKNNK